MSETLLAAQQVRKSFGKLVAVNGVDLDLAAGECLAILGPNGAGKTTLVEILEGLQSPDEGSVRIFGKNFDNDGMAIRERIGVLLQETSLYKRFTVAETFRMFASLYQKPLAVPALIEQLGLKDKTKTQLLKLSGGQKQRVYLGCALINSPDLLFLDEPTTGLDPHTRRETWDLIRTFKSRGRGIILTTHYMEEAALLADRVAIMDMGRIIAWGSPTQLIRAHGGAFVLSLQWQEAAEQLGSKLQEQFPQLTFRNRSLHGIDVLLDDPAKVVRHLLNAIDAEQLTIKLFELRQATLEDVFLKLTGKKLAHETEAVT